MSSVTQRLRAFQRMGPPAAPVLIDGLEELERAYQVMSLIADLEDGSQARILDHVERICLENARRRHEFVVATERPTTTIPPAA